MVFLSGYDQVRVSCTCSREHLLFKLVLVICNHMAGKLFCQPALTELCSANSKQGWREPFSATNQRMTNTGHCRTFPTRKKGREGEGAVENCLESKFLWRLTLPPLTRIPCFSLASVSAEVWDPHRNSGNNDKTSRTKFRLRFVVKSGPSVAIKSPAVAQVQVAYVVFCFWAKIAMLRLILCIYFWGKHDDSFCQAGLDLNCNTHLSLHSRWIKVLVEAWMVAGVGWLGAQPYQWCLAACRVAQSFPRVTMVAFLFAIFIIMMLIR